MKILVEEEYGYRYWVWEPSIEKKDLASIQSLFYERVKEEWGVLHPQFIDPEGQWIWVRWDGKQWVDVGGKPHHPTKNIVCHVHTADASYLERKK